MIKNNNFKYLNIFFGISVAASLLCLTPVSTHADSVCSSVEDCLEVKDEAEQLIATVNKRIIQLLRSQAPDLTENLSWPKQAVSYHEAKTLCRNRGMRLAKVQELLVLAQLRGARGPSKTAYPDLSIDDPEVVEEAAQMLEKGFRPIHKLNASGKVVVDFYYSNRGYRAGYGEQHIWSVSADPKTGGMYQLYEENGAIVPNQANSGYIFNSTRCAVPKY